MNQIVTYICRMDILCLACGAVVSQVAGKKKKQYCNATCRKRGSRSKTIADVLPKEIFPVAKQKKIAVPVDNNIVVEKQSDGMPIRRPGENAIDYALRKNKWKAHQQ